MINPKTVVIPDALAAKVQRLIDTYPDWIRYTGWNTLDKYIIGVVENELEANEELAQSMRAQREYPWQRPGGEGL